MAAIRHGETDSGIELPFGTADLGMQFLRGTRPWRRPWRSVLRLRHREGTERRLISDGDSLLCRRFAPLETTAVWRRCISSVSIIPTSPFWGDPSATFHSFPRRLSCSAPAPRVKCHSEQEAHPLFSPLNVHCRWLRTRTSWKP